MTTLDDNPNQLDLNLPGLGPDTIFAGAGADFIRTATLGGSLIFGQGDNDTITSLGPNDSIYGGNDEDSIRLQRTPAYAYGDAGADTIIAEARATVYGGAANDLMQGTAEANLMFGNEGADIMLGGAQRRDSLYGGKGNDSIGFFTGAGAGGNNLNLNLSGGLAGTGGNEGSNYLRGDFDNDLVVGINQRDTLYGGKGIDTLYGYGSNSYLSGDDDNDILDAINSVQTNPFNTSTTVIVGMEKVTLLGGAGDDSVFGPLGEFQKGKNLLEGGDGNDTIEAYAFQDTVLGGDGNDFIESVTSTGLSSQGANLSSPGYSGQILLDGGRGNDTIIAAFATDTMMGGEGNDSLGGIFNQATGGDGDDTIDATGVGTNAARITLDGGAGNDRLLGNVGTVPNFFNAGSGNDVMVFGSTGDRLIGDVSGNDTISYATGVSFANISTPNVISDFLGNNLITGGNGIDSITTGSGNDILIGGPQGDPNTDTLDGGAGDDSLYGDFGDDNLIGADGNDTLIGGPGADILTGNNGNDVFVFFNPSEGTTTGKVDGIVDFVVGQDRIALSSTGLPSGSGFGFPITGVANRIPLDRELLVLEDRVATGAEAEANAPGQFLVYERLSGNLYFDTNGVAAQGLVTLANFKDRPKVTESDIILF